MYSSVAPPEQAENASIPSGVSQSNWTKFQELRKRREKLCKNSTEKRKKESRKKALKQPVLSQLKSEKEDSILREYGVQHSSSGNNSKWDEKEKPQSLMNEEKWKELKYYLPDAADTDKLEKKTNKEIDDAINSGNFDEAESLSDQLATQDFVGKVAKAIKSKDFAVKRKIEEHEKTEKRKKKKLNWGFEQKQRWESKGNM